MKNPLEGVKIEGRRSGNTTRVIDNIIQLLFNGFEVELTDEFSTKIHQKMRLLKRIQARLKMEHPFANIKLTGTPTKPSIKLE